MSLAGIANSTMARAYADDSSVDPYRGQDSPGAGALAEPFLARVALYVTARTDTSPIPDGPAHSQIDFDFHQSSFGVSPSHRARARAWFGPGRTLLRVSHGRDDRGSTELRYPHCIDDMRTIARSGPIFRDDEPALPPTTPTRTALSANSSLPTACSAIPHRFLCKASAGITSSGSFDLRRARFLLRRAPRQPPRGVPHLSTGLSACEAYSRTRRASPASGRSGVDRYPASILCYPEPAGFFCPTLGTSAYAASSVKSGRIHPALRRLAHGAQPDQALPGEFLPTTFALASEQPTGTARLECAPGNRCGAGELEHDRKMRTVCPKEFCSQQRGRSYDFRKNHLALAVRPMAVSGAFLQARILIPERLSLDEPRQEIARQPTRCLRHARRHWRQHEPP